MKQSLLGMMLAIISLSGSAFAGGAVELPDMQIKPRQTITLKMDKLEAGVKYDVSCIFRSDRFSGKGHSDLQMITIGNFKVTLNRKDPNTNNGVVSILFPLNPFEAKSVSNESAVMINNMDKYDTIFIERCVASPLAE